MVKTKIARCEEIEAQIGRLEIFPGLKMSEQHSSNIFHKSVGDKTDDPDAILLDKAYGLFIEGLALARKGDLKGGAEKICNAFLIDQRSIKYIPKNEICNELEMFVLDNSLWRRLREAARFFDTQVNMEILTIMAHICIGSCVSNMKSNQNRIGHALRSIEKLLQIIEDIPLIKHHYQAMGCDLSKKFLYYLRSCCYVDLENRELAVKALNAALYIDPAFFKARLKRIVLWEKYGLVPLEDLYREMKLIVEEMRPDCPDLGRICLSIALQALKYPKLGNLEEVFEYYNKAVDAFNRATEIYRHKDLSSIYNELLHLQKQLENNRYMKARGDMDEDIAKKTRKAEGRPRFRISTGQNFFSYYQLDDAANKKHTCIKCKSEDRQILKKCPQCNSVSYCSEECLNKDREEHKTLCELVPSLMQYACEEDADDCILTEKKALTESSMHVDEEVNTANDEKVLTKAGPSMCHFESSNKVNVFETPKRTNVSNTGKENKRIENKSSTPKSKELTPNENESFESSKERGNVEEVKVYGKTYEKAKFIHVPVGAKTTDPEALELDAAYEIFIKGLENARKGNIIAGAAKIAFAFLLDSRSIKYFPNQGYHLSLGLQSLVLDETLLVDMIHATYGISNSHILQIIPCICAQLFSWNCPQIWIGRALTSIENLLELIDNQPNSGTFNGHLTRPKLLYIRSICYENAGNYDEAEKDIADALKIDRNYSRARRARAILWNRYGLKSVANIYFALREAAWQLHPDNSVGVFVYSKLVTLILKYPEFGTLREATFYHNKLVHATQRSEELYGDKYLSLDTKTLLFELNKIFLKKEFSESRKRMERRFPKDEDRRLLVQNKKDEELVMSETFSHYKIGLRKKIRFSCIRCRKKGKMMGCTGCNIVSYCGKVCQVADWTQHEPMCNKISYSKKAINARIGIIRMQGACRGFLARKINLQMEVLHMEQFRLFYKGRHGIIQTQSICRGMFARKHQLSPTILHLKEFRQFYKRWKSVVSIAVQSNNRNSWTELKDEQTFIRRQELFQDEDIKDTNQKLDDATAEVISRSRENHGNDTNIEIEEIEYSATKANKKDNVKVEAKEVIRKIHLTADTEKWLRTCDSKYRDFFIRRIKQLASGDTSRILRKRLKGSTRTIYEVYLEQKSGFRILWTEEGDQVLIWYVAKHKHVSRLIKLIDDSRNRSDRTRVYIDDVEGLDDINASITKDNRDRREILLDPLGNVPLKRYEVTLDNIDGLSTGEWKSSLVLTEEERDVVETKGTVLLLGRSGTGKTICICNRMEYDRQIRKERDHFTQLFVARSAKLCRYVEGIIGSRDGCEMVTFHDLRDRLENELPTHENIQCDYSNRSSKYMDFFRFKKEMFSNGTEDIDPLVVWTNIRSFIKGSIETLRTERGHLSKEEYLALGKKRCRYSEEQRETIYGIFQRYQDFMDANELWDENDRIIALLRRLKLAREANPELLHNDCKTWAKFEKVYVDEVQDYTQVEILLFFMLGGAGNLFLAGDPAQNVARGVEFRFTDIRSVGYYVAGNDEGKKELIPQKPKMVNINFRSHAGILQCAASILAEMFHHFPNSVKMLKKDAGLFQGPRPEVLPAIDASLLQSLIKSKLNGVVVLTHDENVEQVKDKLDGYELVYGIRHCKGLEFKSVIIMDFFSNISSDLQTPWKEMLLHRADNLYSNDFALQYPEIEAQLKLFYTAITRCIERLFFVETTISKAGDAFIRWSTTTSVIPFCPNDGKIDKAKATLSDCTNIESMSMNRDEWLAAGLSNAEAADAEEYDYENKCSLLKKALYCFEQGRHDLFVRKAKVQLRSVELRMKILDIDSNDIELCHKIEKEAVCIMRGLFEADMESEVMELCSSLRDIMNNLYPSSDFLQRYLIAKGS